MAPQFSLVSTFLCNVFWFYFFQAFWSLIFVTCGNNKNQNILLLSAEGLKTHKDYNNTFILFTNVTNSKKTSIKLGSLFLRR